MDNTLLAEIRTKPAHQQPQWDDRAQIQRVRHELWTRPPLVSVHELTALRAILARVYQAQAQVLQLGDCAEDPAECTRDHIDRKLALQDQLAGTMRMNAHKPVVRVGRVAGQFGKPRSSHTERIDGMELPVYRGHMVNGPDPDPEDRRPDPLRLLTGYMAASDVMDHLGWRSPAEAFCVEPPLWTSHEALLLDYEVPMLRRDAQGQLMLASTHWPWIGERTRQVDGAHVALLAKVVNPVACKIGPNINSAELLTLCERLDPAREPGRLTLIARMGTEAVTEQLPPLVEAVRSAGHPVIWLSDPMHGNTVTTPSGLKTRFVETITVEVQRFQDAVGAAGGVPGGLHLEVTPKDVTECVLNADHVEQVGERYASFCDPRLSPGQARSVVSAWRNAEPCW